MDRQSEIRRTDTRKACEALLDQIREVLADREEQALAGRVSYPATRSDEVGIIGAAIQRIAEREDLRWGEADEDADFLEGFEGLEDTDVDPDAPIPFRVSDENGGTA